MMINKHSIFNIKRLCAAVLCLSFAAAVILPFTAYAAAGERKVVRIGWYDSPVSIKDENGQRSGYDYIYEQKLAAYTGWTYEYVEGSRSELLQMLKDGKIDMMGDISYTEELSEYLFFPTQPMGSEDYYIFASPDNTELIHGSITSFSEKTIGVAKGSAEQGLLAEWAKKNNIKYKQVELSSSDAQAFDMLKNKTLDAVVASSGSDDPEKCAPVCMVGSSDHYFAVTKQRSDIFEELEKVLNRINEENRYFNQQMQEKYINGTGANLYLNDQEKVWLASHGTIKVGYVDNYLPFCDKDDNTQKMTGALKEYLEYASSVIKNADLRFDSIYFATLDDALTALEKGYINCIFPANISEYDAENMGLALTPSVITAEIYQIVRTRNRDSFKDIENITAAVSIGDVNCEKILDKQFPEWEKAEYTDEISCLHAVSNGNADTFLTSNYRYNIIAKQCEDLNLTSIATGMTVDYTFAAKKGETELYSILNKTVGMVPSVKINSLMTKYIFEKENDLTLGEFIKKHLAEVFEIVAGVLLIILLLAVRSIRAMKRARRSEELIASAEIDKLTGIYSKNFLFEYALNMQKKAKGRTIDTIVIDIEHFHSINSLNGQDFGDKVLNTLGQQIKLVFNDPDTIAGRIDADIFCIYRWNKDNYDELLTKLQSKLEEDLPNIRIRLRMGVLPAKSQESPENMFERARIACNMSRGKYDQQQLIVYDDTVSEKREYEQRLINDLKRAIQDEEFEVYYQPQYDIQSEPAKLISAEALVRWRHPEFGMVMPGSFIPLFERNGLIGEVDKCVWKKAARQVAQWKQKYGTVIPVSVNLSRIDIFDENLKSVLGSLLIDNELGSDAIKLEVTESAYTENANQVINIIKDLRMDGYMIELDDFGTGYSSLGMLSSMPIDILKIDRSFIINTHNSNTGVQMVKLIIDLAKEMEIPVIAEGVEEKSELMMLKEMGCDLVQGYYFSKPLPIQDFEKLLEAELAV